MIYHAPSGVSKKSVSSYGQFGIYILPFQIVSLYDFSIYIYLDIYLEIPSSNHVSRKKNRTAYNLKWSMYHLASSR